MPLALTAGYWRNLFDWKVAAEAALTGFGALWLLVEILGFFLPDASRWLAAHPLIFWACGVTYLVFKSWPKRRMSYRLTNRDIRIELRIDDILECKGALAMSATRTFETDVDGGKIAVDSLQGKFTRRYYSSCAHFQTDVDAAIAELPETIRAEAARSGGAYPVGTTVRVRAPARTLYLMALPGVNEHGTANASFEDLQRALPGLWECVQERGELGTVLVPILGSGRARVREAREVIVREIVQSFVAACSSKRFCEELVIVISPQDFHRHELDFVELGRFVRHLCKYTSFSDRSLPASGTGLG